MAPLDDWLKAYGLERYHSVLYQHAIDLDIIGDLSDGDFQRLGIPLGDRLRLRNLARYARADVVASADEALERGSQLRVATVLFADIVGSTDLAERLEIEDHNALLRRFFESCTAIVIAQGGAPSRYIGDSIVASFGLPTAAEDDAVRAATAAFAIIEAARSIKAPDGEPLRTRIGIATGLLMTAGAEGLIGEALAPATGKALNLAARLQNEAEPNAVLSDEDTRRLLDGRFAASAVGPLTLKGFSEPRFAWRLGAPSGQLEAAQALSHPSTFVGRRHELAFLMDRWGEAPLRGRVALVSGEAGIGKSRLVREFVDEITPEAGDVYVMACGINDRLRPLQPVIGTVRDLSGVDLFDEPGERRARLEWWGGTVRGLDGAELETLADLLSLSGEEPAASVAQVHASSVFDVLTKLFARRSVPANLIVLEDLQWADPTTEAFLEHLAARIDGLGLMVVCTHRDDHEPTVRGEPHVDLLGLSRLGPELAATLLREACGNAELPPQVAAAVIAKADGVPLFVEELTKSLLEGELAGWRDGDPLENRLTGGRPKLPSTLLALLLARLDRIANVQHVAPIGAAIGRIFSRRLLMRITPLAEAEAERVLSGLIAAGLLSRHGWGAQTQYAFTHALVQDAAYETLPRSRRKRLHDAILAAMEDGPQSGEAVPPEALGHHAFLAERFVEATRHWQRAAKEVRLSASGAEAVALLRAALSANERTEDGPDKRAREIELREALYVPQQVTNWASPDIAHNMQRLRALRIERGDEEELLDVLHALGGYHVICGEIDAARQCVAEIRERYGSDDVAAALASRLSGFCAWLAGEFEAAVEELGTAKALAAQIGRERIRRFYHPDTALVADAVSGFALALADERDRALAKLYSTERDAEAHEDRFSQFYAYVIIASTYQVLDDAPRCGAFCERAALLSDDAPSEYWIGWNTLLDGWSQARVGKFAQGVVEIRTGIARYEGTGGLQTLPYAKTVLADALIRGGELEEAEALIEELTVARRPPQVRYVDLIVMRLAERLREASRD